jgi:hypothetical protein
MVTYKEYQVQTFINDTILSKLPVSRQNSDDVKKFLTEIISVQDRCRPREWIVFDNPVAFFERATEDTRQLVCPHYPKERELSPFREDPDDVERVYVVEDWDISQFQLYETRTHFWEEATMVVYIAASS